MPLADTVRNSFLNALCRNTSYANAAVYVKLHSADPGTAGLNNVSANATRHQATFGSVAGGGAIDNTIAIAWTSGEVTTSETYAWISLWTAASGGSFLGSAILTQSKTVNAGDTFSIPIGDLDLTIA